MNHEQFKQLKKHLLINSGATLNKDGAHAKINGGYIIAKKTLFKRNLNALTLDDVNGALIEAKRDAGADYVGFEVVGGVVAVEFSTHAQNIATAMLYANKYKQKRIYNASAGVVLKAV